MPHLDIRLLGPPRIDVDGQPVTLPRAKALALLAMLAESSTPLRRDTLATMLWPEHSQSQARAGLRRVLAALTRALGHDFFNADRETIGLNWDADVRADVDEFRTALAQVDLDDLADDATRMHVEAAVACYQGDFLTGFSLRDAPAFDGWQFQTGETLRLTAAQALDALIRSYEACLDLEHAIVHAQRLIALDPLDERGHAHLMRLLARTGQRAQALRQYDHCVQVLDDELGVPPAPATAELAHAIRTGLLPTTERTTLPHAPEPAAATDEIHGVSVLSLAVIAAPADETIFTDAAVTDDSLLGTMAALASAAGAHVDHIGIDGALICCGVPHPFEDDPERILHLAFAVRQAVRARGLDAAVGIKTGPAYVHDVTVSGPVINQAAALQRRAAAGEILIDRNTFRRVRGAFALETCGDDTFRALHPLPQTRKARGIRNLHAPMIGRDGELAALLDAYVAVRGGAGQAVFIKGEAGVGKSRLVAEFHAALAGTQKGTVASADFLWLEGRCLEMGMAAGYWPFRELLRAFFGWRFEENATDFAAHIETRLRAQAAAGQWTADQLAEIGAVIGALLSLQFGNAWDARLAQADAAHLRYRIIDGMCRLLTALAATAPVILVLEDLHWADDLSIDLLVQLLDELAGRPILLLCVHRPAAARRAGQLAAIAAAKCPGQSWEIDLHALTPADTARLVELLLEIEALDQRTKEWILERAQGNPFFTEEVVRALIDAGLITRRDARWETGTRAAALPTGMDAGIGTGLDAVPHSVDSLIHARVDQLAAPLRRTLQSAAVIGRTFPRPVLHRLTGDDDGLDQHLWELETRGFLYQERVVPVTEYSFHHVLTQEAVYRMITPARRMELHRHTAVAMEAIYAGELDDQVERIAYHYARTDDHEKAADYLLRAGRKARRAYLNEEAVRYLQAVPARLEQVVQHTPPRAVQADIAQAEYLRGRVLIALGRMTDAEQALRNAIAAGRRAGQAADTLAFTYFWLCEAIFWQDDFTEAVAVAREGLSLLPPGAQSTAAAILTGTVAVGSDILGDYATFQELTDWLAGFIQQLPFCEELSPAYHHVIDAAVTVKDMARALAYGADLEKKAQAIDDLVSLSKARYLQGRNLAKSGRDVDAFLPLEDGLQLALKTDESTMQGFILNGLVNCAVILGRFQAALNYAKQLDDLSYAATADMRYMGGQELLGRTCLAMADLYQAQVHLRICYDASLANGLGYPTTAIIMWGWACLANGEMAEARRLFGEVVEQIPPEKPPPLHEAERKPPFLEALAGLERALNDPKAFRDACANLRTRHGPQRHRAQQWYLEPTESVSLVGNLTPHHVTMPPAHPWHWIDPVGDGVLRSDNGMSMAAADGRDLWYVNGTAPRLVRPVAGDFVLETCCAPVDPARPAMGGLLLWHDLRNFVRLDWGARGPDEISFMGCIDGEDAVFGRGRLPGARIWLRLERTGPQVRALCSADGRDWFTAGAVSLADVAPWQAGIFAVGYVDRALYPGTPAGGGALRFTSVTLWSSS